MRHLTLLAAALFAAMVGFVPSLQASERFGSFAVFDQLQDAILLDGPITNSSPADFKRAMAARPKATILVLGSVGGVVPAALKLAKELRRRGMSTAIPSGFGCYSACAYLYFAGVEHVVKGELGVHRISAGSSGEGAGTEAYFEGVKRDLAPFAIPEQVLRKMAATPPADMHVFSSGEIAEYALNRTSSSNSLVARVAAR